MGRDALAGSAAQSRTSARMRSEAARNSSSERPSHRAMASASPSRAIGAAALRFPAT